MTRPEIDHDLQIQFESAAEQAGCELVHAEFKGGLLRLVLDREGGVDLGHCETVSKQVSALLDVADFGRGKYTLEVSSPGLDRQLYRLRDYRRFVGHRVRVTWRDAETARKTTVVARLEELREAEPASIELAEANQERLQVRIQDIEVARLEPEF